MTLDVNGMCQELETLRRGEGIRASSILDRVGPQSQELSGITDSDTDTTARLKLTGVVDRLIAGYSDVERVILRVSLGMDSEAQHAKLERRYDWLAVSLRLSKRTVQRRAEELFQRLARDAVANARRVLAAADLGYVVTQHEAILRMDLASPVVVERHRIAITQQKLDDIVRPVSVPHDAGPDNQFTIEVLAGGRLTRTARQPGVLDLVKCHIEPPEVLRAGDIHECRIRYAAPAMGPFLGAEPYTPYDAARYVVYFQPERQPSRVWRLDAVSPWQVTHDEPPDDLLPREPTGRYEALFVVLHAGRGYGLRWEWR